MRGRLSHGSRRASTGPRRLTIASGRRRHPAAGREWLVPAIDHTKEHELGKGGRDAVEEGSGQNRRAQIAHRARENLVERFSLLEPEPNREPFLYRTANLAPQLGRERLEQRLGDGWERQHDGDFSI